MKELQTLTHIHINERTGKSNYTYLGDIVSLVPDHSNKANISIKQVT